MPDNLPNTASRRLGEASAFERLCTEVQSVHVIRMCLEPLCRTKQNLIVLTSRYPSFIVGLPSSTTAKQPARNVGNNEEQLQSEYGKKQKLDLCKVGFHGSPVTANA